MLYRPLTPQEIEAALDAARIAVQCYDAALAIPAAKIPTPLHGALYRLKATLEVK